MKPTVVRFAAGVTVVFLLTTVGATICFWIAFAMSFMFVSHPSVAENTPSVEMPLPREFSSQSPGTQLFRADDHSSIILSDGVIIKGYDCTSAVSVMQCREWHAKKDEWEASK